MGIIFDANATETKICSAYGLTVYGIYNQFIWTIENNREENVLIFIRITDTDENEIFSMQLGNNCIFQCRIDDTMDNFLYWIATEKPDTYMIEKQVYKSLCASDSLFNHVILQRKEKEKNRCQTMMNKKVLVLNYIGNDNFERPVYENGTNLFVDVDPRKGKKAKICTKLNNCLDDEPDTPIECMKNTKV